MLLGKIGWGVRIVQVAAGGGLVRDAHSLLLTSTGRVLSFGSAQYGQLGHGFDAGKQLSDCLRPRYIEALKHEKCICVAAGELHSGAVTADGDVYTWGEGWVFLPLFRPMHVTRFMLIVVSNLHQILRSTGPGRSATSFASRTGRLHDLPMVC